MDMSCRGLFDPNNNVNVRDVFCEILVRVDPECIFNCILVSREWFEVITQPSFRQKYLNLWKEHTVVGLFVDHRLTFRCHTLQFWPTTKLGRHIYGYGRKSMAGLGTFISKSWDTGLILSGTHHPNALYVSNPISGLRLQLPQHPYHKSPHEDKFMANVVSDPLHPPSFKVILAKSSFYRDEDTRTLNIQTYCSSTMEWVQSTSTCSTPFSLSPGDKFGAGIVTGRGIIYWKASRDSLGVLAVYDTDSGRVSLIPEPGREAVKIPFYEGRDILEDLFPMFNYPTRYYGVSPQGGLRCAIYKADTYDGNKAWEHGMIRIVVLDDDSNRDWNLLYEVELKSIWSENCAVLKPLFKAGKPPMPFCFVSFVPGKANSIYVGLDTHIFIYHFDTHLLKRIYSSSEFISGFTSYHPTTLLELAAWPHARLN